MKILLTCIVLLSISQYAFADISLTFKTLNNDQYQPSMTYSIKAPLLKFSQTGQNTINLYNRKTRQFTNFDKDSGNTNLLDESTLNRQVSQLKKNRLIKLQGVEKELQKQHATMSTEKQEAAQSVINILKYPDLYGEHTFLKVKKIQPQKQINNINCQVYQLYRNTEKLKSFCLATPKALKMSPEDYQTLRSFYAFNYTMQSQLFLAMGNTKFTIIDYKQHKMPGIVIEDISYENNQISHHQLLQSVTNQPLKHTDFKL
jgi:hypothetical protein